MRILLVAVLLLTSTASAEPEKARASFKRGMAAFLLNHFDEAIREFEEGFQEEPLPAFLYNIGQAHVKSGRRAQGLEFFRKYLDMIPDDAPDRADVERQARELDPKAAATTSVPPAAIAVPAPAPAVKATTSTTRRPRSWVWLGVVVGSVVVVGGVVGASVAATTPVDVAERTGSEKMPYGVTWP